MYPLEGTNVYNTKADLLDASVPHFLPSTASRHHPQGLSTEPMLLPLESRQKFDYKWSLLFLGEQRRLYALRFASNSISTSPLQAGIGGRGEEEDKAAYSLRWN